MDNGIYSVLGAHSVSYFLDSNRHAVYGVVNGGNGAAIIRMAELICGLAGGAEKELLLRQMLCTVFTVSFQVSRMGFVPSSIKRSNSTTTNSTDEVTIKIPIKLSFFIAV